MPTIEHGRVVWGWLASLDGRTRKDRPAVVFTKTEEIQAGAPFVVVVCSTQFDEPLQDFELRLPWNDKGTSKSRLTRPTVAVCKWLRPMMHDDVSRYGGVLPSTLMLEIAEKVAKYSGS